MIESKNSVSNLVVENLFPLPLLNARVIARCEGKCLLIPRQHVRIEFEGEACFGIVFRLQMQIVQFINVSKKIRKRAASISCGSFTCLSFVNLPQIHFLPVDFILVKIEQVHCA